MACSPVHGGPALGRPSLHSKGEGRPAPSNLDACRLAQGKELAGSPTSKGPALARILPARHLCVWSWPILEALSLIHEGFLEPVSLCDREDPPKGALKVHQGPQIPPGLSVQASPRLPFPSSFSKSLWQMLGPSTHTPSPNPGSHLQN